MHYTKNSVYDPRRCSAVVIRLRHPKTTALIFSSGKMICTGAKSEQESKVAARKFARLVQKTGFQVQFLQFKIQTMMASGDVKFPIRMKEFAREHNQCVRQVSLKHIQSKLTNIKIKLILIVRFYFSFSFEPESFHGLHYKMTEPKMTVLVINTGKVAFFGK